MKELPKFYNSKDETLQELKGLLSRGVKDRKSNFHYTTLCTTNEKHEPQGRTVVLRGFDSEVYSLFVHSDYRAKKIDEINKNKNVSLVFYDDKKKIQIRLRGNAFVEQSKKQSWEKLSLWSRRCYLSSDSPGIEKNQPSSGFSDKFSKDAPTLEESETGIKNFSVISILINEIEWLYLASQGHRRILFQIIRSNDKIKINSKWLVP